MFIKHLILVAIVFACVQIGRADNDRPIKRFFAPENAVVDIDARIKNQTEQRTLDKNINRMKSIVRSVKNRLETSFDTLKFVCYAFGTENVTEREDFKQFVAYINNVINKTTQYYDDVETKARADGVLDYYTSPYLFAMGIASENKRVMIESFASIINDTEKLRTEEIKTEIIHLMTNAVNLYFDLIDALTKIQEANPREYFIIETEKRWYTIHERIPTDCTPDVQRVVDEISAAMKQGENKILEIEGQILRVGDLLSRSDSVPKYGGI